MRFSDVDKYTQKLSQHKTVFDGSNVTNFFKPFKAFPCCKTGIISRIFPF